MLANDSLALGRVIRWIAVVVAAPRFWSLRDEWPDLHQEALARVVESLRQARFDPSRDFQSYVLGVARYTCLQALARRRRSGAVPLDATPVRSGNPGVEDQAIDLELARRVLRVASDDCRALMRAYFYDGRSYEEIASSLALPVGTVKSRLFRCLQTAHRSITVFRVRRRSEVSG